MSAVAAGATLRSWLRYGIALAAHHCGADAAYRRLAGPGLVVLMLHRLRDEPDPWPLSLSTAAFARVVSWMRGHGTVVALEDGLRALDAPGNRGIGYAITFDDGYRDNLRLLDVEGTLPATVYVATGHVAGEPVWIYRVLHSVEARTRPLLDLGRIGLGHFDLDRGFERTRLYALLPPRLKQLDPAALASCIEEIVAQLQPAAPAAGEMLDWGDIARLAAHGVDIGAHTRGHVLLARSDGETAHREIVASRDDIAAATGSVPRHFAYPNGGAGDFGPRDVATVREAGFRTAATSIEGVNRRGTDPYRILRHNVHDARFRAPGGRLSRALFLSETSGLLGWLRARRAA